MRARVLGALALLAMTAACTYESGAEDADPTTTLASTTTAPGTSTTTTVPSTTTPPATCPPGPTPDFPPGARDASERLGDFDGNGSADLLQVFNVPGASPPWHLRVALTGGSVVETRMSRPPHLGEPASAIGGKNIGGSKADEIFAVVGKDREGLLVGLFALRDCQIDTVRGPAGEDVTLHVGDTFRKRLGVDCPEGTLVQLEAESRDGRVFTTKRTPYRYDGNSLAQQPTQPGGALTSPQADPFLVVFSRFHCGLLGIGPTQ